MQENGKSLLLDTSIVVALVTGIGYLNAYFYTYSYWSYFGAPNILFEVTAFDIFLATAIFIFFGLTMLGIPSVLHDVFHINNKRIQRIFFLWSYFGLFTFIHIFLSDYGWESLVVLAYLIILSLAVYFDKSTPKKEDTPTEKPLSPFYLSGYLANIPGKLGPGLTTLVICGLIIPIFLASDYGEYKARTRSDFLVIGNVGESTARIILSKNTEYFVLADFAPNEKRLIGNFSLSSIASISNAGQIMRFERIGPLAPPFK